MDRRQFTTVAAAGAVAGAAPTRGADRAAPDATNAPPSERPFRYCLNTSTISGQQRTLPQLVEIVAEAGYQGIEVWVRDLHRYADDGNDLAELGAQIAALGLRVESAIGFARWMVDNDAEREQGLGDARRDMEAVHAIGGARIAAPPAGAAGPIDLQVIAARYRALLEVGGEVGVVPQLELWGHSPALSRIGQLLDVAAEAAHRDACLLPDVYHIYKGGSAFDGLRMIAGARMHVFHMNDYPADPPRDAITDAHRIYPGDGVAPIDQIVRDLYETGFRGVFSLELFNRQYWQQDPLAVAKTGLAKMQAAVERAVVGLQDSRAN